MTPKLTVPRMKKEAAAFAREESSHAEPKLFGVTDGKAVGTYIEHKFQARMHLKYKYEEGSSAKGIDFPQLGVDLKTTSIKQPQSSCPFKSARQKVFGLGYHLLVFVYEKSDDQVHQTCYLNILHTVFIDSSRTADYQTTTGLIKIIENKGNVDDVIGFFAERMMPMDDIQAEKLALEVLKSPPTIGYLTISNALQWRLQYARVIQEAGKVPGVEGL